MSNTMSNTGKVHNMQKTHAPETKHATMRNVNSSKASPQSDTEGVKITKDSLTQGYYNK